MMVKWLTVLILIHSIGSQASFAEPGMDESQPAGTEQDLQSIHEFFDSELTTMLAAKGDIPHEFELELHVGTAGTDSEASPMCTATATFSIPGFTEVTSTDTAPTCIRAGGTVIESVNQFLSAILGAMP
jgi:hypothetical protein